MPNDVQSRFGGIDNGQRSELFAIRQASALPNLWMRWPVQSSGICTDLADRVGDALVPRFRNQFAGGAAMTPAIESDAQQHIHHRRRMISNLGRYSRQKARRIILSELRHLKARDGDFASSGKPMGIFPDRQWSGQQGCGLGSIIQGGSTGHSIAARYARLATLFRQRPVATIRPMRWLRFAN